MGRWGQWACRVCSWRERRIRAWRISCSTIPLVRWWRTATCCITLWARRASSLNRVFHRHVYVTEHKVCTLCPHATLVQLFPLISIHFHPHIVADPPALHHTSCIIPSQMWVRLGGQSFSSMEIIDWFCGAYSKICKAHRAIWRTRLDFQPDGWPWVSEKALEGSKR